MHVAKYLQASSTGNFHSINPEKKPESQGLKKK